MVRFVQIDDVCRCKWCEFDVFMSLFIFERVQISWTVFVVVIFL